MKIIQFVIIFSLIVLLSSACASKQSNPTGLPLSECLPAGIKLADEVGMKNTTDPNGHLLESTPITLEEKLAELHVICANDKTLTDASGKKIYLYSATACWQGVAPDNYQELLAKQASEMDALQQQYIVVEIPCGGFVPIAP